MSTSETVYNAIAAGCRTVDEVLAHTGLRRNQVQGSLRYLEAQNLVTGAPDDLQTVTPSTPPGERSVELTHPPYEAEVVHWCAVSSHCDGGRNDTGLWENVTCPDCLLSRPSAPNRQPKPSSSPQRSPMDFLLHTRRGIALLALLFFLFVGGVAACAMFDDVPPGHVGVKVSFAQLQPDPLPNNWYLIFPWEGLIKVSTQERQTTLSRSPEQADCAVTADSQNLGFAVQVSWSVEGNYAPEMVKHFRDPETWDRIIASVLPQAAKSVFSQYELRPILRQREARRREIRDAVVSLVDEKLLEKSPTLVGAIRILQVTLDNLDYSQLFADAIEQTMLAEQQILEQRNQLTLHRVEQAKRVVEAQAAQQAELARARGAALARLIEFEAELTRLGNLVQLGIDPNLLFTWERMQEIYGRWDGSMPRFTNGGNPLGLVMPLDMAMGDTEFDESKVQLMLDSLARQREALQSAMAEERALMEQDREDLLRHTADPSAGRGDVDDLLNPQTQSSDE